MGFVRLDRSVPPWSPGMRGRDSLTKIEHCSFNSRLSDVGFNGTDHGSPGLLGDFFFRILLCTFLWPPISKMFT